MATTGKTATELKMDPAALHREDLYTDRKMGTIRVLTPVTTDGATDSARPVQYLGEAQILTPMGAIPLSFQIDAVSLAEAIEKFADAAKVAVERTAREIQELRREAASSIVIPDSVPPGLGGGGLGGGGGKIQMP
ncbi:MAG: hypothetical protein LJE97_07790 [Betaproteobacteria bacterium]|jgi:hypothetical protein|nr:hypothetical protein [Betaproteobacteria bacterium]